MGWGCHCTTVRDIRLISEYFPWSGTQFSPKIYTHEYVVLKKWDVSVPILLSPCTSPGWPDTAGSRKAGLIALQEMDRSQFSFRTQLMTGGCPRCARTHGNTPKDGRLESRPSVLTRLRGLRTTLPFLARAPSMCYLFFLSGESDPLSRGEIKIPWAKERKRNGAWKIWSLVPLLTLLTQLHTKSLCESSCQYQRKMSYYRDYIFSYSFKDKERLQFLLLEYQNDRSINRKQRVPAQFIILMQLEGILWIRMKLSWKACRHNSMCTLYIYIWWHSLLHLSYVFAYKTPQELQNGIKHEKIANVVSTVPNSL